MPPMSSMLSRLSPLAREARSQLPRLLERWLPRALREAAILVSIALAAASLVLFAQLTDEVIEGETHAFDEAVLLALRHAGDPSDPIGPGWFEDAMRDFTALGSLGVLAFLTAAVTGFLILQGKRHAALLVVVAIGGGILVSTLTKLGFDRPRPDLVPHGATVYTASFPSGHSMMSAVTYLTLGALLARVQAQRRVHWPTDVLAGWALGAAWALLCWAVALWLQLHGKVETGAEPPADGEPAQLEAPQSPPDRGALP
jgi:undecaprenyl-diphosphatase